MEVSVGIDGLLKLFPKIPRETVQRYLEMNQFNIPQTAADLLEWQELAGENSDDDSQADRSQSHSHSSDDEDSDSNLPYEGHASLMASGREPPSSSSSSGAASTVGFHEEMSRIILEGVDGLETVSPSECDNNSINEYQLELLQDEELARQLQREQDEELLEQIERDAKLAEEMAQVGLPFAPSSPTPPPLSSFDDQSSYSSSSSYDAYNDPYSYQQPAADPFTTDKPLFVPGNPFSITESWRGAEKLTIDRNLNVLSQPQLLRLAQHSKHGTIPTIYKVLKPPFLVRFLEKKKELQKKYGRWSSKSKPRMAFHATRPERLEGIMSKGLVVPGSSGVTNATDSGWYGAGIYLSPEINTALSYGTSVLVCSVLLGRMYRCKKRIDGQQLRKGYDSHCEPFFNQGLGREWILFDSDQVLPLYLLRF